MVDDARDAGPAKKPETPRVGAGAERDNLPLVRLLVGGLRPSDKAVDEGVEPRCARISSCITADGVRKPASGKGPVYIYPSSPNACMHESKRTSVDDGQATSRGAWASLRDEIQGERVLQIAQLHGAQARDSGVGVCALNRSVAASTARC